MAKVITDAYVSMGRDPPARAHPHTIRKLSTSLKEFSGASVAQIVRSGTWTSYQTFATFYRLDFASVPAQADNVMLSRAMDGTLTQT